MPSNNQMKDISKCTEYRFPSWKEKLGALSIGWRKWSFLFSAIQSSNDPATQWNF